MIEKINSTGFHTFVVYEKSFKEVNVKKKNSK